MKRLFRSQTDRHIAGVCGGLAAYFRIDPSLVRIAVVILALLTAVFPFIVGYTIAAFIIPNEQDLID